MRNHAHVVAVAVTASVLAGVTSLFAAQAPVIDLQPVSQTVPAGTNVQFIVSARGQKPLFYQWQFNAVPMGGATNDVLFLSNVQCPNAGIYSVTVSNNAGAVISSNAVLAVTDTIVIVCPPEASVPCTFDVPPPDPGSVLATNSSGIALAATHMGDFAVTNSSTITLSRLYGASDLCGNFASCVQTITVNILPPRITGATESFTLETNVLRLRFSVQVEGTPPFEYTWVVYRCTTHPLGGCDPNFGIELIAMANTSDGSFTVLLPTTAEGTYPVSIGVRNPCGEVGLESSGGISYTVPVAVTLSRGFPAVKSGAAGSGPGPLKSTSCGVFDSSSQWFKMTANDTGLATVSTKGSGYDAFLGVFTGPISAPSNLRLIACSTSSNRQSRVQFMAAPETYWLVVGGGSGGESLRLTYGFEPQITSIKLTNNGVVELRSSIAPPLPYLLQASEDVASQNWVTLLATNILSTNGASILIKDTMSESFRQRFYRLVPGP